MGRGRNIKPAGGDEEPLKIVVATLGHTCGVRVQGRAFGVHSEHDLKEQRDEK